MSEALNLKVLIIAITAQSHSVDAPSKIVEIEIVEQESDKFKRWIKESICIRSNTPTMNRDEGAYQLSPIWTQVISTPKPGAGRGRLQSDFARLSQ